MSNSVHYSYDALHAKNPRALRVAMLRNNNKYGISFEYRDFSFVNGKWYCWYRFELKDLKVIEDLFVTEDKKA